MTKRSIPIIQPGDGIKVEGRQGRLSRSPTSLILTSRCALPVRPTRMDRNTSLASQPLLQIGKEFTQNDIELLEVLEWWQMTSNYRGPLREANPRLLQMNKPTASTGTG